MFAEDPAEHRVGFRDRRKKKQQQHWFVHPWYLYMFQWNTITWRITVLSLSQHYSIVMVIIIEALHFGKSWMQSELLTTFICLFVCLFSLDTNSRRPLVLQKSFTNTFQLVTVIKTILNQLCGLEANRRLERTDWLWFWKDCWDLLHEDWISTQAAASSLNIIVVPESLVVLAPQCCVFCSKTDRGLRSASRQLGCS